MLSIYFCLRLHSNITAVIIANQFKCHAQNSAFARKFTLLNISAYVGAN